MKKPVVAAIALLLAGTAAYAAVSIGVFGVCPLSGMPIHCSKSECPPTPDCQPGDPRCTESSADASASVDVTVAPLAAPATPAAAAAPAEPATESPCAKKWRNCRKEAAQVEREPAQAPASEPASRP